MVSSVKLADLWQRLGYKVVVVCMGRGATGPTEKAGRAVIEKISDTLEVHWISDVFLPDPWNYGIAFGFSRYVASLAKSLQPDVIVVNKVLFWSSIALLRLRRQGHKVLLITDALVGITWWPRGAIAQVCAAIYAHTLGRLILKKATQISFFHPQPEEVLQRLGIAQKSQVIPTGIDPTPFSATRVSPGNPVTVTYIGRLESVKGVDDFVAAAVKVKKDRPELSIQVVGWYKPDHPLVAQYRDRVTFTGLRSDIPAVLASSDIFVLPSYSEGLSNALMEAMSAGCACIASEVGGNRFLIQNGISGFLFPAGDREALGAHIRRLLDDPAKRISLGEQARKRIQDVFSWPKVGEQYRKLFETWNNA